MVKFSQVLNQSLATIKPKLSNQVVWAKPKFRNQEKRFYIMEYSIKDVAKNVEISEQGLYKRIKTNYAEYIDNGYILVKQVEQPNGTTKEQIFITRSGIDDLLKTKKLRKGVSLKGFEALNQTTKPSTQPLNQVEQPNHSTTKLNNEETMTKTASNELLNLLNQTIADLKEENKRLNEKLDKQESRFDEKLEQQKLEFKEQYDTNRDMQRK